MNSRRIWGGAYSSSTTINIREPQSFMDGLTESTPSKPILYCRSGVRSAQACQVWPVKASTKPTTYWRNLGGRALQNRYFSAPNISPCKRRSWVLWRYRFLPHNWRPLVGKNWLFAARCLEYWRIAWFFTSQNFIGDVQWSGHVEVHRKSSDWWHHKHHHNLQLYVLYFMSFNTHFIGFFA